MKKTGLTKKVFSAFIVLAALASTMLPSFSIGIGGVTITTFGLRATTTMRRAITTTTRRAYVQQFNIPLKLNYNQILTTLESSGAPQGVTRKSIADLRRLDFVFSTDGDRTLFTETKQAPSIPFGYANFDVDLSKLNSPEVFGSEQRSNYWLSANYSFVGPAGEESAVNNSMIIDSTAYSLNAERLHGRTFSDIYGEATQPNAEIGQYFYLKNGNFTAESLSIQNRVGVGVNVTSSLRVIGRGRPAAYIEGTNPNGYSGFFKGEVDFRNAELNISGRTYALVPNNDAADKRVRIDGPLTIDVASGNAVNVPGIVNGDGGLIVATGETIGGSFAGGVVGEIHANNAQADAGREGTALRIGRGSINYCSQGIVQKAVKAIPAGQDAATFETSVGIVTNNSGANKWVKIFSNSYDYEKSIVLLNKSDPLVLPLPTNYYKKMWDHFEVFLLNGVRVNFVIINGY